jgi:hypothetical protein
LRCAIGHIHLRGRQKNKVVVLQSAGGQRLSHVHLANREMTDLDLEQIRASADG